MQDHVIATDADIARGLDWLVRAEPRFGEALAITGPPPLRRRAEGFGPLLRIVISQQVSVAAAEGIWKRVQAAGADSERGLSGLSDADLRACGLSAAKVRYARAIAEAALDYPALRARPEPEAMAELMAIPGIGRWTAEIYLLFCVGRADVFAPGDLALQEASRMLFSLPDRPNARALDRMAAAWSPWRAVAARQLWAYYAVVKRREGVPT